MDAAGRIAELLRKQLSSLHAGARLPSVRELMEQHAASPVTVQRALAQLQREGRVVSRPGDGTFVAQPAQPVAPVDVSFQALALGSSMPASDLSGTPFASAPSELLPLGTGYMDLASQPLALLRAATLRAARREHVWSRLHAEGLEPLRAWFARDIGGEISSRQVLIVPGGQSGLSAVLRALVPSGAPLLFESPTYFGALAIARAAGIRPVPVPTDREGVLPDALEAAIASSGARALYLQPTYANPSGATLSQTRRRAIIELAQKHGIFLIEDDYARDLNIEAAAPAPLVRDCPSHVVYIRSLTKTVAPGMRIAAIAALGPVFERLRTARAIDDWFVSGILQETALELVSAPGFRRHLEHTRETLRERRDAAVAAIASELPAGSLQHVPRGGFNMWLALPPELDDLLVAQAAARAGVHINPGRSWFPAEPLGPHLRLSYAAASPSELREGIKRLGRVIDKARR
ncbi:MAG: PLP-dependent aminotransferase family protein [Myxococcaceae bacterium]|nr:PLP-dependent aminotransferase family protein [Myxococcaceae bacterium]